jgi:hypothetical protein
MMWSMAALSCNRQDSYLEMIHVEGAHTTSEEVSSAIAPLANIIPVQPATDEDSVDSDEGERRAVACIAKEEDKIREKESRISAANEVKGNKESFRNTLRQQSETKCSSAQKKREDTQDVEKKIDRSSQQGGSFNVYCETCKKDVRCTKPVLIELADEYKPGYSHEAEYHYHIPYSADLATAVLYTIGGSRNASGAPIRRVLSNY